MEQPQHDLRPFQAQNTPRRVMAFSAAVVLQVAIIYALASGLASQMIDKLPDDIKADIVKEKPPEQPKTPPPPPPDMVKPPPPFIPPPDIVIANDAPTNAITAVTNQVAQPKPAISAPALLANRGNNCSERYYPPLAVRLNHEGSVVVAVHVGADGAVQAVDIKDPGPYPELGPASVQCITEKYHFEPATLNGQPVAATKLMRITWKLR